MRIFLLSMLLLAGGCASTEPATSRFDARDGSTRYESARFRVGLVPMSSGLVRDQRVLGQAFASCAGQDCTPQVVELAFLNISSSDLNLDSRRVEITFDGTTRSWEDESRQDEPASYAVPRGEFMRVPLTATDFARLAGAQEVEVAFGQTGTSLFRVSFGDREVLRALAEQMRL